MDREQDPPSRCNGRIHELGKQNVHCLSSLENDLDTQQDTKINPNKWYQSSGYYIKEIISSSHSDQHRSKFDSLHSKQARRSIRSMYKTYLVYLCALLVLKIPQDRSYFLISWLFVLDLLRVLQFSDSILEKLKIKIHKVSDGANTRVEEFDGQRNLDIWKHKMLCVLEILGLDSVLEEEVIKMDDPSKEEDGTKSDVDPKRAVKVKRVRSLIKMSLSDQIIRKVMKENSALGIWKALEKDYQTKSLPNRIYLKAKICKL